MFRVLNPEEVAPFACAVLAARHACGRSRRQAEIDAGGPVASLAESAALRDGRGLADAVYYNALGVPPVEMRFSRFVDGVSTAEKVVVLDAAAICSSMHLSMGAGDRASVLLARCVDHGDRYLALQLIWNFPRSSPICVLGALSPLSPKVLGALSPPPIVFGARAEFQVAATGVGVKGPPRGSLVRRSDPVVPDSWTHPSVRAADLFFVPPARRWYPM